MNSQFLDHNFGIQAARVCEEAAIASWALAGRGVRVRRGVATVVGENLHFPGTDRQQHVVEAVPQIVTRVGTRQIA